MSYKVVLCSTGEAHLEGKRLEFRGVNDSWCCSGSCCCEF